MNGFGRISRKKIKNKPRGKREELHLLVYKKKKKKKKKKTGFEACLLHLLTMSNAFYYLFYYHKPETDKITNLDTVLRTNYF